METRPKRIRGNRSLSAVSSREFDVLRIAESGLSVAICLAVLAFGGAAEFFLVPQSIVLGIGALVLVARPRFPHNLTRVPFVAPLVLVALVLFQLLPLPASLAQLLGTQRGDPPGRYFTLSIAPYQTASHLLLLITYFTAFFLVLEIARDPYARRRIALVLIGLGTFEALYGLLQYLAGWQHVFWYAKKYYLDDATGTYINRNHFAGFLEMVLPLAIAMALVKVRRLARADTHQGPRVRGIFASAELTLAVLWLFLAGLIFTAILFSRSRMGIVSAVGSLIAVLALARSSHLPARTRILTGGLLLFGVAALFLWIGNGALLTRFESVGQEYGQTGQNRVSIWRDTLKLIYRHPLAGSGLGTFAVAYPSVQTAFLNLLVDHAHCDYLEMATELGLPGAMLLFGSLFWVLARAVRRYPQLSDRSASAICLGCAGGIAAILLHSFTDFNLHIPANALVFSTLAALAWSAAQGQQVVNRRASFERRERVKRSPGVPSLSV